MSDIEPLSDDGAEPNVNEEAAENKNDDYATENDEDDYVANNEDIIDDDNEDEDAVNFEDQLQAYDNDENNAEEEMKGENEDSVGSSSLNLSESTSPSLTDNADEVKNVTITKQEELKMIYLRSFLNKVNKNFDEKDLTTRQYQ